MMISEYAIELDGGGSPNIPAAMRKAVGVYRSLKLKRDMFEAVRNGYLEAKRIIYEASK